MVNRRDVVRELKAAGFKSKGGTKHEKFTDGVHKTQVPRHHEIGQTLYREIRKQAGLD
ncbi:MAG: type II toxin-antitoxin system HicA family toxin [Coriobacteriales bacterium]|jgi:hypothetical protein|nr:type II toxin-antitoxin system HicA family toxin [Coriobacteriales bacterium]